MGRRGARQLARGPAEHGQERRVGQPGAEPDVGQGQQPLHGGGLAAHGRGDRRPGHGHRRLDGHVPAQGRLAGLLQGAGPDPADVGPADVVGRHGERGRAAARRGPGLARQGGRADEDDLREPVGPAAVGAEGGRLLDLVGQGAGAAVGHVGPADGEGRGQPAPVEGVEAQPGLVDQEAGPEQHHQQGQAHPGRPPVGGRGRPGGHEHEHEGQHGMDRPDDQAAARARWPPAARPPRPGPGGRAASAAGRPCRRRPPAAPCGATGCWPGRRTR